ncbi:MAG: cysteine hydrolase [bacterium]
MQDFLIVIDMQVDFIDGSLGSEDAIKIVPEVAKKIKEFDGIVIFTRDTHFDDYLDTQEGQMLPVPHCIKGTTGHDIHPDLTHLIGKFVHDKFTFGAKNLPDLINDITNNNYSNLSFTLVGLCTDICVISNAMILKAFYPEAVIIVDSNCCAGVTKESHENALNSMKMCQINII